MAQEAKTARNDIISLRKNLETYRGIARPGHTRALGYFALPSAAFPAIKMAYKL